MNNKETISDYNKAVDCLNETYDAINKEFFEGALSKQPVTIQSSPGAHGHFTTDPNTWISKTGNTHEINIGAGSLNRPTEEIIATLLHEMVHFYNHMRGIKDCSRGGKYHNKKFRDAAEAKGLHVTKDDKYGWAFTEPTEKIRQFLRDYNLPNIEIYRNEGYVYVKGRGKEGKEDILPKKKSSTRKYICPRCGTPVRATKEVRIMCIDCNEVMVKG